MEDRELPPKPLSEAVQIFSSDLLSKINPKASVLPTEHAISSFKRYVPGSVFYGLNRDVEYWPGGKFANTVLLVPHGGYKCPEGLADRPAGCHEADVHTQELALTLYDAMRRLSRLSISPPSSADADSPPPLAPVAVDDDDNDDDGLIFRDFCPHMVVAKLHRSKVDMNRPEQAAVGKGGSPRVRMAWRQYHAFARRAKRAIYETAAANRLPRLPYGLVLDLHGQSHDLRSQIGYVLRGQELLDYSDAQLDASAASPDLVDKCSIAALLASSGPHTKQSRAQKPTLSGAIRGACSFGALLEAQGPFPCVPSPSSPTPAIQSSAASVVTPPLYFNGGYSTQIHGSSAAGARRRLIELEERTKYRAAAKGEEGKANAEKPADTTKETERRVEEGLDWLSGERKWVGVERGFVAVQIETAYVGHRDSKENLEAFANALAASAAAYVEAHGIGASQASLSKDRD